MKDTMPQVARYWNTIAHDFDAIYTGDNKSRFARFLDKTLRSDMYQRFDWVMDLAGDLSGKTVCDVGCGSGRFVTALAKHGAAHLTGVDVAPEMIALAKSLAAKEGVAPRCEFIVSDVLNWQATRIYDLTIAIGFWDYIQDPSTRLAAIRQFTGQRFLSAWPRLFTWRMPIRKARLAAHGCPVYFFTQDRVFHLLQSAGFTPRSWINIGKLFCVEAIPH